METTGSLIPLLCAAILLSYGDVVAVVDVTGISGRSVLLDVNPPPPQGSGVSWIFNNQNVAENLPPPPVCYDQLIGKCQLYVNGSLRIDSISSANEGSYLLAVRTPGSTVTVTTEYRLRVYAPLDKPVLRILSDSMYIVNGTNVTLLCDAGTQTVTTYTFSRDDRPICTEPYVSCRGSSLDFTPISEIYNGFYTCRIENPVSSNTSDPITVTVSFRISDISLMVNTSELLWPGLDSVSLRCSARGTNVSYSWSLDGEDLPAGSHYVLSADRSVLTISPVSSKDNGSFTCTAANGINSLTSPGVLLNLGTPVSAVSLSSNASSAELWAGQDSVSLHCSAQGSAITFSWSLDGKPVSSKPPYYITESNSPPYSSLTIIPVSRNDGGPFTCTASNRLNNETSNEIRFNVNWHPDGEMSCPVTSNGHILSLVCSWENGRPPANVTMTFNGTTGMNPNLVTRNVSSTTLIWGSVLNCSGDQLGKRSTCLRILEPPYSPGHNNNTIKEVLEGGSVTLTIDLMWKRTSRNAVPTEILPATFTWYKDKTEIKSGITSTNYSSNLHISELTQANSGRYECTARNVIGSETFIFNVNVTAQAVPPDDGLDGGEIAGIVIGVLAGLTIIGIIVFFIVKKRLNTGVAAGTIYENADFTPDHTYETKLPGVMVNPATQKKEESNYQELLPHNEAMYDNVLPGPRP